MKEKTPPKTKICIHCKNQKLFEEFALSKASAFGRKNICKVCANEYTKNWCNRNIDKVKKERRLYQISKRYGLSPESYTSLLAAQDNRCAICGKEEKDNLHGSLYVDHCHVNSKVRGLLCDKCNTGLGHFLHNKDILDRAIKYLEERGT